MNKAPDAFRTISEVSDWLDTPTYVLRFWESRFSQIKPVKRAGGRRYYRPEDMQLLGGIKKLLHFDGHTIKGVQTLIKEKGAKHVAEFSPGLDEQVVSPSSKDEEPKIDLDSLTKEVSVKETKAAPLQLKASTKEATPVVDKKKQGARAVKVTVHKKAKITAKEPEAVVEVAQEPTPVSTPKDVEIQLPKGKLMSGPFKVGPARSYDVEDFQTIETLYYSLKMVRNNMKRAHKAR